jgi:lipopolysaccharide export system protein LptA
MRIPIVIVLLIMSNGLSAQVWQQPAAEPDTGKKKIEIIFARYFRPLQSDTLPGIRLLGNVVLRHDTTFIYCDSVYLFEEANRLQAFDNIKVEMSDSVTLYCDRLRYDGETRVARARRNILLTSGATRLTTQQINYFRTEAFGEYQEGGRLVNGDDTLTSRLGYFYPKEDMAYFRKEVVLQNPEYRLETDTLGYDTEQKIAYFQAYTRIENEDGVLETSDGSYNTETNQVQLAKGNQIENEDYVVTGDSLYFDNESKKGYAYDGVLIEPKDSSLSIEGRYGEFDRNTDESFVTEEAVAVQYFEEDTLYITADTLYSYQDSLENRIFRAYHHVYFYMNDLQGQADSLVYLFSDSTIALYGQPYLWADSSQISASQMTIFMKNNQADSMYMKGSCFVVSQADTVGFNQIKGREMQAKFVDNKLNRLTVSGNSETIFFAKDEESGDYLAKSQASSQQMLITFQDNQVQRVKNIRDVQATLDPYWKVMFDPNQLEGMRWLGEQRPERPESPKAFAVRYAEKESDEVRMTE